MHKTHLDRLVVDWVDAIDPQPQPNKHQHRLLPPLPHRALRRSLNITPVHRPIHHAAHGQPRRLKFRHKRLDRSRRRRRPEPLSHLLPELLAHEREAVDGKGGERGRVVDEEGKEAGVLCVRGGLGRWRERGEGEGRGGTRVDWRWENGEGSSPVCNSGDQRRPGEKSEKDALRPR